MGLIGYLVNRAGTAATVAIGLAAVASCSQTEAGRRLTAPVQAQAKQESSDENGDPAQVTLALGETATAAGLSLLWSELEEDSRCPAGVQCIWQGRVVILLEVAAGSGEPEDVRLTDDRGGLRDDEQTPGDLADRLTLVRVEPYPQAETPIPESDYRATIQIQPE